MMSNFEWSNLSVQQKVNVKQHAIDLHGKRWHTAKPDFCGRLNSLQLYTILSAY